MTHSQPISTDNRKRFEPAEPITEKSIMFVILRRDEVWMLIKLDSEFFTPRS